MEIHLAASHTFSLNLTTGTTEDKYCSENRKIIQDLQRRKGKKKKKKRNYNQEDMAMFEKDDLNINLEATELTLGLPGCTARGNKRALPNDTQENPKSATNASESTKKYDQETAPPTK